MTEHQTEHQTEHRACTECGETIPAGAPCWRETERVPEGYTLHQLAKAFRAVAPSDHWKNPIRHRFLSLDALALAAKMVDPDWSGEDLVACIERAVPFYTGSPVKTVATQAGFVFEAAGYFATVGA